jgi:hypothetical protein
MIVPAEQQCIPWVAIVSWFARPLVTSIVKV